MQYYILLIFMTLLGSFASYFLKKASFSNTVIDLFKCKSFYLGGALYFVSAVINIILLKHLEYSTVLPLTALTYFWTILISSIFLKEILNKRKLFGTLTIIVGVFIIVL